MFKKNNYLFCFFVLWVIIINNCTAKNDSDYNSDDNSIANEINDTLYLNHLNDLSFDYIISADLIKAEKLIDTSIKKSWNISYYKGLGTALNHKGLISYYKSDYKNALIFFNFSCFVKLFISDYKGLASTYSNLSLVYQESGNFSNAIYYNLKSLLIRETLRDTNAIAISYNNIGTTYHYMGMLQKALMYYKKAMRLNEKLKNEPSLIYSLSNIALIYFDLGKQLPENLKKSLYDSAIVFNLKTLELEKKHNDSWGLSITYNNLATIYAEKNEISEAIFYYDLARKNHELIKNEKGLSLTLYNLAYYNFINQKVGKSIQLCEKSLKIAIEIQDVKQQTICYKLLSDAYAKLNNYEIAFKYIKKYNSLTEKYYNLESQNKVNHLQKVFDENVNEFKKLSIEASMTKQSLKKNKTFLMILFVFVIIVIILSLSLYFNFIKKRKALHLLTIKNNQIINQNKEIHEKNELLNKTFIQLEHKNNSILSSLRYAQKIQETIFPIEKKIKELGISYFVIYKPKDIVSGDFVWMAKIDTEKYFIAIIDCTGHGVPGAFLSLIGNTILNQIILERKIHDPALILEKMQEEMVEIFKKQDKEIDLGDGMDVCICKVENDLKILTFAGANRLLYYIENKELKIIKGEKITIGSFLKYTPKCFTNHEICYNDSITVYMTTDGYIDQMNKNGKRIGADQFNSILMSLTEYNFDKHKNVLIDYLAKHQEEEEQTDDITIIGFELK